MSVWPNFSNISDGIISKLNNRKDNNLRVSSLNVWVRITSGASPGMTLYSNPDIELFGAAGIYGDINTSGTVGMTWGLKPTGGLSGGPLRPSPVVSSLEIDEGNDNLARQATFTIECFTKAQMEEIVKFYLEPGYSMFIEWGWNTPKGAGGLVSLDADTITKFQSFKNTDKAREAGGFEYDNYLGYITGGGVTVNGDKWSVSVKCTGYAELAAYLLTTENGAQKGGQGGTLVSEPIYGSTEMKQYGNIDIERWMKCYNNLPGTRQTAYVKSLETKLADKNNFIGFDEQVEATINDSTDGYAYGLIKSKMNVGGEEVTFPGGTEIVSKEKFIRFGALMEIFSAIGIKGYKIKNTTINFKIKTDETVCSAFKNMYSIDSTKLFIPNKSTPSMKLSSIPDILTSIDTILSAADLVDNRVGGVVEFPNEETLNQTQPNGGSTIDKSPYTWGYLHDLYVNFEFAKSIMDTKAFSIKDALYQILNGMSAGVNGMWDFQIIEHDVEGSDTTELRVYELNCITETKQVTNAVFDISGPNCIFIDSSFDMELTAMKMNQVIASRLSDSADVNGDNKHVPKSLFSGKTDLLNIEIVDSPKPTFKKIASNEVAKETNLNLILGKLSFYPKVELTDKNTTSGLDLFEICYLGAFNDSAIFSALKNKQNTQQQGKGTAPLMNIEFTFKIHGISGIKRGQKFRVNGVPEPFSTKGFFQVITVKHSIEGMTWTTDITGGFRPNN
jgi:hypothetical protein